MSLLGQTAGGECGQKQSPVETQFLAICRGAGDIHDRISIIEDRLASILSPSQPKENAKEGSLRDFAGCPLAESLQDQAGIIRRAVERLSEIIGRIAV